MKVFSNEKLIKRNALFSKALSALGLIVLLSGLAASFLRPEWYALPFYTLIIGFTISNVGMFLANRYVREPRPDRALTTATKGLDDRHRLYHYRFPAHHTLVTPSGVYAITAKFQGGSVEWDDNHKRLRHSGVSIFRRFFGQESLGRPLIEAGAEAQRLAKFLAKQFGENAPPVFPLLVFTNPKVDFGSMKATPIPVLKAKRLNPYLRKRPQSNTLSETQLEALDHGWNG